ncbi:MAG: hypothetical protein P4L79_10055 [Legionella sp.]|uniref:hypothetical protein n=1 Tax=Legionella sp. TaxID=459 RepID=UPI002850C6A3|nr:hypothetical protein [Legionella sp.]
MTYLVPLRRQLPDGSGIASPYELPQLQEILPEMNVETPMSKYSDYHNACELLDDEFDDIDGEALQDVIKHPRANH